MNDQVQRLVETTPSSVVKERSPALVVVDVYSEDDLEETDVCNVISSVMGLAYGESCIAAPKL